MPKRREFLKNLSLATIVSSISCLNNFCQPKRLLSGSRPNIIFILSDDVNNVYNEKGQFVADGVTDHHQVQNSEVLFQEKALQFIQDNKDRSFFLYYATQLPHGPVITPDLDEFKDKNWSLKHKEWAAMMKHLDDGIGNMIELLEKLDILKDTIIFFAGDNGYSQWGYFGRKAWEDDDLFNNKGPWHAFRPHPAKDIELYRINDDPGCQNDLSKNHPEIIKKVKQIFKEAHEDSEWYANPGETEEIINRKKQKAIELNSLQTPTKPNSTVRDVM